MRNTRVLGCLIALSVLNAGASYAQNFGSLIQRSKVVLTRKLPPTGHIDGSTIKVVTTATGLQADLATDLKSTLESLLIRYDSRLRSEEGHADATITCRITTYSQPQPQSTTGAGVAIGKKGGSLQSQPMVRVTGILTVSFQAQDTKKGRSIAADTVTAKFDREYPVASTQQGMLRSMTSKVTHLTKGAEDDEKPPTAAELHNKLIEDAALQIAAHLVNTTEQVEVYLARGAGLDDADKLAEQKLWTRALEQLETMKPFDQKEQDAYRLYNLGVVNEALAYNAEDISKAKTYLQQAAINYGKAIDGKPSEKYFLQPQTRIDTALAHYKILGTQAAQTLNSAAKAAPVEAAEIKKAGGMTNDDVISMTGAKLDEANIIDTIQHAEEVDFDLSPHGQVELAKGGVNGRVITAMKARARKK